MRFCANAETMSICVDVSVAKARLAKLRLFAIGDSGYYQLNARDPRAVALPEPKRKPDLRATFAAIAAFRVKCRDFSLSLTLPCRDYCRAVGAQTIANAALAALSFFVKSERSDCTLRLSQTFEHALLHGRIELDAAEALLALTRCLSAARRAKG